jgi:hypothetical protein
VYIYNFFILFAHFFANALITGNIIPFRCGHALTFSALHCSFQVNVPISHLRGSRKCLNVCVAHGLLINRQRPKVLILKFEEEDHFITLVTC